MKPYYSDDYVTLYHGNCRDLLPTLAERSVDLVLTDPPYSEETHAGARTIGRTVMPLGERLIDFACLPAAEVRPLFCALGRVAARWIVSFVDWRHIHLLEMPASADEDWPLRFIRFGIWVKPNGLPQLTGDRPATGWEAIAMLHRSGVPLAWNGGGAHAVYQANTATSKNHRTGNHPTAKPRPLIAKLITQFSDPGHLILDPFAGSGTTLHQAKKLGRRAIGVELDERYCEAIAQSLSQDVMNLAEAAA